MHPLGRWCLWAKQEVPSVGWISTPHFFLGKAPAHTPYDHSQQSCIIPSIKRNYKGDKSILKTTSSQRWDLPPPHPSSFLLLFWIRGRELPGAWMRGSMGWGQAGWAQGVREVRSQAQAQGLLCLLNLHNINMNGQLTIWPVTAKVWGRLQLSVDFHWRQN